MDTSYQQPEEKDGMAGIIVFAVLAFGIFGGVIGAVLQHRADYDAIRPVKEANTTTTDAIRDIVVKTPAPFPATSTDVFVDYPTGSTSTPVVRVPLGVALNLYSKTIVDYEKALGGLVSQLCATGTKR